jgi:hypothetical protein
VAKTDDDKIVFSNGNHKGNIFEGIVLPCERYPKGGSYDNWDKDCFKPIPKDGLTIHIQND